MKDMKEIFLQGEADAYFNRNKEAVLNNDDLGTPAVQYLEEYLSNNNDFLCEGGENNCLEIGCASGYNLEHIYKRFHKIKGYGIEPSKDAVEFGMRDIISKQYPIQLLVGTSDELPFPDNMFKIVMLGFCMFWIDRKYLFKTVAEVDRVLQTGGVLLINDFDTSIPYKRVNCHNAEAFTYKMDYSKLFLANPQYFMIGKTNYSHISKVKFHEDVQERLSTVLLYKEAIDSAYLGA